MRKTKRDVPQYEFSILALDDDPIMTDTLKSYFQSAGFHVDTENNPLKAIERVRNGSYDIMLLDFLMTPICGDQVVEQIRVFNQDIYIILLTGHKSLAPPIRTIRELEIQGYYEKSDRFDQLELLVESCVKSIRQMRTIRTYQESTSQLVDAMPDLYRMQKIDETAANILQTATSLLEATSVMLIVEPPALSGDSRLLIYQSGTAPPEPSADTIDDCLAQLREYQQSSETFLLTPLTNEREKFFALLAVEASEVPGVYLQQLFLLLARQSAAALRNHTMTEKLHSNYLEMVQAIRLMVDARDVYTSGHSDRVAYFAHLLAVAMGLDHDTCERVRIAGLFHDIGKLGVPDKILLSNKKLTLDECAVMKNHPRDGSEMLAAVSFFKDIAPIIQSHHERMDGTGYPDGLFGDQIPIESKIISIADSFDAMSSARRYRRSKTHQEAIDELLRCSGSQFDEKLVNIFIASIQDWSKIEEELTQLGKVTPGG